MNEDRPRLALGGGAGRRLPELAEGYLLEYFDKIELATRGLDDAQIWARSGPGTNSIANLMLHLCGNLSLWVCASLGEEVYVRDRAAEFAADRTHSREELLEMLRAVVARSRGVVVSMESEALDRPLEVQGYATDGRGVVFHAVEHMSYHSGQIVQMAKSLLVGEQQIEFYPHLRAR